MHLFASLIYSQKAFQPTINKILAGKLITEYHQYISVVQKLTKMDCGWPLQHCYDMVIALRTSGRTF